MLGDAPPPFAREQTRKMHHEDSPPFLPYNGNPLASETIAAGDHPVYVGDPAGAQLPEPREKHEAGAPRCHLSGACNFSLGEEKPGLGCATLNRFTVKGPQLTRPTGRGKKGPVVLFPASFGVGRLFDGGVFFAPLLAHLIVYLAFIHSSACGFAQMLPLPLPPYLPPERFLNPPTKAIIPILPIVLRLIWF